MLLRLATAAMGTRFELVLEGPAEAPLRAAGEAALEEVEACEQRYSLFRRDSLVSRLGREAGAGPVRVDGETFELLAACLEVQRASEGAFDVSLAGAMRARGLHGEAGGAPAALERATGGPGFELDRERSSVRFTRPGAALDLGGVAKGEALDRAAARLRELGVERAFLHGGTSSGIAIGSPPDSAWRIALASPPERDAEPAPTLELEDAAWSVSAPHGRVVEHRGRPTGHLLDPLSPIDGPAPAAGTVVCVTGPSARDADAWSTALAVRLARHGDVERALEVLPAGLTVCLLEPCGTWRASGARPDLFRIPTLARETTR